MKSLLEEQCVSTVHHHPPLPYLLNLHCSPFSSFNLPFLHVPHSRKTVTTMALVLCLTYRHHSLPLTLTIHLLCPFNKNVSVNIWPALSESFRDEQAGSILFLMEFAKQTEHGNKFKPRRAHRGKERRVQETFIRFK